MVRRAAAVIRGRRDGKTRSDDETQNTGLVCRSVVSRRSNSPGSQERTTPSSKQSRGHNEQASDHAREDRDGVSGAALEGTTTAGLIESSVRHRGERSAQEQHGTSSSRGLLVKRLGS